MAREGVGIEYADVTVQAMAGRQVLINYPDAKSCEPGCEPTSRNITVHVDYDDPEVSASFTNIIEAIKVYYRWGVIGHEMRADLVRGVPVTLSGPRIIVAIEYPVTEYESIAQPPPPPARQPSLRVKCSIGLDGTKPGAGITGTARFTQTVAATINAGASSAFIAIPRWAVAVALQTNDAAVVGLELRQFAGPNGFLTLSAANIGKGNADTVPIANGAVSFVIVNAGAVAVTGVRAIFYLAI